MRDHRTRLVLVEALLATCLLTGVSPAAANMDLQWKTSGSGGNHRWATARAIELATARGTTWVDSIAIERADYPDTVFLDFKEHNANWWGSYPSYWDPSWGNRFGKPQDKVQQYYDLTVAALRRGDRIEASKNLGYMSHYLADVNGPLHTESSATENRTFHNSLEYDASITDFAAYLANDGYQFYGGQSSPSALTVANATASHEYYADLVASYAAHGFDAHVRDIEGINLNRGVNAIADLIQSAAAEADSVTAVIDSVSPSACTTGVPVSFAGHGADAVHNIGEWRWRSNRDGLLSTQSNFTTSTLSMGVHNIYFKVKCNGPIWSAETFRPIVIGAQNTKPRPVYRFFNPHTGVHFYTASDHEMLTVRNTLASTYNLEGIAYALDTSSTANVAPLYRFWDKVRSVHFMTADESERATLINTLGDVYSYDGIVAYVSKTSTGSSPIWRFYNFRKGVHFYTASKAERDMVIARLGETYRYEGLAYYYDPPW